MARRQRNRSALAGLAALGALGYISGKGPLGGLYKRREGDPAPVEDRSTGSSRPQETFMGLDDTGAAGSAAGPVVGNRIDEDIRRFADVGTNFNELGQPYSLIDRPPPDVAPARPPAGAVAPLGNRSLSGQGAAVGANRADLRGYDDMYANRVAPLNRQIGMGEPGYTKEDMDAFRKRVLTPGQIDTIRNYKSRAGTRAGGPPVFTSGRRRDIAPTREEAIAQIPTGGIDAPEGGSRINSSETGRNLANIAAALGPTRLAGFANAGIEAAFLNAQRNAAAARNASAAQNAAAARRAQLAEEARRGQTPTNLTSTTSRSANKRTKKIDDDNTGVEFKRGGKTKKMASGGMTSASKRGDGIASKGKTKCKMY